MNLGAARKWMALYFLLTTAFVGVYLLIFAKSILLPLSHEDANACFQILIPVLVGQIAIIFQWISTASTDDADLTQPSPIPSWAIRLPPLLVLGMLTLIVSILIISNRPASQLSFGPEGFKSGMTFAVSILNASTVLLVPRLFPKSKP